MDAHIRYIAINCAEPAVTAGFYAKWFGMRELGRSAEGHISVTDGWVNLSLLKLPAGSTAPRGLSHFGVAVDSIAALAARLDGKAALVREPGGLHYGEHRIVDPNGFAVSLSERGFHVPAGSLGVNRLRHVSMSVPTGPELMSFYVESFGFREVSTSIRRRNEGKDKYPFLFVGDGEINLAFLPRDFMLNEPERELTDEHRVKGWFGHIGLVVPDSRKFFEELGAKSYGVDMAECRVYDPERNHIDLSQTKGFEVDLDKWVRAA